MVRMLMIMHHNTLCTPCIALVFMAHICTYAIDPAELKMEVQGVQVQWRLGGQQASSDEDTNIVLDQGKPRCI
jgi:hypothetical protein